MIGKYDSLRDAVVHRATLDGTCDTVGDVDTVGWHASRLEDFYGSDYIVIEDERGAVTVETFTDHIAVSGEVGRGYYTPVADRWEELRDEYMSATNTAVWVCEDCYIAHHYGWREIDGKWYAGEGHVAAELEPLNRLDGATLYDWTHSESGRGIREFDRDMCDGCGSRLGGSRYRLMLETEEG